MKFSIFKLSKQKKLEQEICRLSMLCVNQIFLKCHAFCVLISADILNPIQEGTFRGYSQMNEKGGGGRGWGTKGLPPKIFHTYPTVMKLGIVIPYLKKTKTMYESRDTPLEFCWHQCFFTGNQQILLYQEIQIKIVFWYIISNSFNFF